MGTRISVNGNDSFLQWEPQFPTMGTGVSLYRNGSNPSWERE
ncbi:MULTISPECIES: hypothetical protein [Bacteroides]|nr:MULTISPECIES: hypothetical protein [Bacteroides]